MPKGGGHKKRDGKFLKEKKIQFLFEVRKIVPNYVTILLFSCEQSMLESSISIS